MLPLQYVAYAVYMPVECLIIDLVAQVDYCNDNSIEFLAINRAHGRTYSVGNFTGLMVDLGGLRDIEIQPDEASAWFQGGTYDGQVTECLWERGFVASQ